MRFLLLALWLACTSMALAAPSVQVSKPERVGTQTVQYAYVQPDPQWSGEQVYFLIDGKKVALPPVSLGYDRMFSFPRWIVSGGRITGLKYWQFNKEKSTRRVVTLSYPGYRVLKRGVWAFFPGSDVPPDPPK